MVIYFIGGPMDLTKQRFSDYCEPYYVAMRCQTRSTGWDPAKPDDIIATAEIEKYGYRRVIRLPSWETGEEAVIYQYDPNMRIHV